MAKKKKKTFQKSQLLSMFKNENYQKVISKIKQFEIEGMDDKELQHIKLTSYEQLAQANFESGDIVRAIRDIESLLTLENSESYQLIKLKYLCYMEHFEDAVVFAEDLILSKENKIKKEAIFFYLLANIYSGNYEYKQQYLKLLPLARQKYILGLVAFFRGNREEALVYFGQCNPRAKIEKENLQAVKAIVLNQEMLCSQTLKPLYHLILCGEDKNLQNTKNSRVIKKEVFSLFTKKRKESGLQNLLSLTSSTSIESILQNRQNKEQQTKLIYNNMVLLIEKEKNYSEALILFVKYRNDLVSLVESAMLFISIKEHTEDRKSDNILIAFFGNYLKLHHKKLSEFQLNYIFMFLIQNTNIEHAFNLTEAYGGEDMVFLLKTLPTMSRLEEGYQESFNQVVKRYSQFKETMLKSLSAHLKSIDDDFELLSVGELEIVSKRLSWLLILLQNLQKPHKKYEKTLFDILSSLALVFQSFEIKKYKKLYIELSKTIDIFIDYYSISRVKLSVDIKALLVSIDRGERIKTVEIYEEEDYFSLARRMLFKEKNDNSDRYDFNEEEYDLTLIKKDFIEALKNNQDPFNSPIEVNRYSNFIYTFILDLIAKAVEYNRYDKVFVDKLLSYIGIELNDNYLRDKVVGELRAYAKKDAKIAILFFDYMITHIESKDRAYVWYLKWLEGYIIMVDDYNLPQDITFKGCLHHFIRTQQKKKFKSLNAKYKKIIKRFEDKGLF